MFLFIVYFFVMCEIEIINKSAHSDCTIDYLFLLRCRIYLCLVTLYQYRHPLSNQHTACEYNSVYRLVCNMPLIFLLCLIFAMFLLRRLSFLQTLGVYNYSQKDLLIFREYIISRLSTFVNVF